MKRYHIVRDNRILDTNHYYGTAGHTLRDKNHNGVTGILDNENVIIYFKDGKIHREDGPAVINRSLLFYWLKGKQYTKEQYQEIIDTKYKKTTEYFKNLL